MTRVVVIGGGIVGVTAALTLAEGGAQVTVLERGSVAGEASGLNAGIIGGGGWGHAPDIDVVLRMGSRDRYLDLVDERGHRIGLDRTGTLTLIRTEAEWEWASGVVEADRLAGRQTELVGPSELAELEPSADRRLLGAILDPLAVRAEPVLATRAFAAEAASAGAAIATETAVVGLRPAPGGGWEVEVGLDSDPVGDRGGGPSAPPVIGAEAVVVAAGPWCRHVGAMVGVDIPVEAVRGQMWASRPTPPLLRYAMAAAESSTSWAATEPMEGRPPSLTHDGDHRVTRHLYGRQRPNGELVFGGDRVHTADRSVDDEGIAVNQRHVAELLPAVRQLPPARAWAGLMPFSRDGRPLIGQVPDRPGLYLAAALASSGFGRGPMTGQLVADLVLGRIPEVEFGPVDPTGRVGPLS